MKNWHTEKVTVNDTMINSSAIVPPEELVKLMQIATFNHSQKMALDHSTMLDKSNAFWVVTKIKLKIFGDLHSQDKVSVSTWTHELSGVRAKRDCEIKLKNKVVAKAVTEWCCLDAETRKIRRLSSIVYPELEMEKTKTSNLEFSNLKIDVTEKHFAYSRVVRSTDIDVNNHTNNMKYVNMAMDALTLEELKNNFVVEFEIYFMNESYFKDEIDVFKYVKGNTIYIEGKIQDKSVFKVIMKTKKKID